MSKAPSPRFSERTLRFVLKASRQKRPDWLERNREDYEGLVLLPLQHLARHLKTELATAAPGYHFPQKGIGRLKRPAHRIGARSGNSGVFKDWISYSASRPAKSRFERNPSLFFLINPTDRRDSVLVAGGLYMPSSRQLRTLREAIARDASAFDRLFATKDFARAFPGGFSGEKASSRPPRGFDPGHPRMGWLKLQAYFVWRSYTRKQFGSAAFAELVARDCKQILRLNALLDQALQGSLPRAAVPQPRQTRGKPPGLLERLEELENPRPPMDF